MRRLRKGTGASGERRIGLIEEMERLAKRAFIVPLAAPFLLLVGYGLGKLTARGLELPEGVSVREVSAAPRIQFESLSRLMTAVREVGSLTEEYVRLYQDHVAPIELALQRRGVDEEVARQVAWPLVEHAYRRGLDPVTVASVLLVESRGEPRATSPVGARGLMQVMPSHIGRWGECGPDLYAIEDNLCNGTSILAWYLRRFRGDERRALLGYNGCVRGTNTPDCFRYPEKVDRERRQILAEIAAARSKLGRAASP